MNLTEVKLIDTYQHNIVQYTSVKNFEIVM